MSRQRRHGLTMVELLAALGLLAVIVPSALMWITHTTQVHREASNRTAWHAAAEAVLQLIHDEIRSGDFDSRRRLERVAIVNGVLQIRTRDGGAVVHRYDHELITRSIRRVAVRDEVENERTLLLDVESFEAALNLEEQWLDVRITGPDEQWTVVRRYSF